MKSKKKDNYEPKTVRINLDDRTMATLIARRMSRAGVDAVVVTGEKSGFDIAVKCYTVLYERGIRKLVAESIEELTKYF